MSYTIDGYVENGYFISDPVDPVDPIDPVDEPSSAFSTSFFQVNDQVRVIGTTKVMTIGAAKFVMAKYGIYEVAYTVSYNGQTGLILEKLLEKAT